MLKLIRGDATVPLAIGDTVFKVRKLPHGKARALRLEYTRRGVLDSEAFHRAVVRTIVAGWENLAREDESLVEFQPEIVLDVVDQLPDKVVELLVQTAMDAEFLHHEALGNSAPSSGNGCGRTETPSTD